MTDPIPDKALHILVHVIETLSKDILHSSNEWEYSNDRVRNWLALEFFWNQLEQMQHPYCLGRLSLHRRLARIIVAITAPVANNKDNDSMHAAVPDFELQQVVLEETDHSNDENAQTEAPPQTQQQPSPQPIPRLPYLPLTKWTRKHWDMLEIELDSLRNQMIRRDAKEWVLNDDNDDEEKLAATGDENPPASYDPELCHAPLFHDKLNGVFKCLDVYRVLSPFRDTLEQQLQQHYEAQAQLPNRKQRPRIDSTLLENFEKEMEQEENVQVQQALRALLEGRCSSSSSSTDGITFLPLEQLHAIFQQTPPFALQYFVTKLQRLLQKWAVQIFGASYATTTTTSGGGSNSNSSDDGSRYSATRRNRVATIFSPADPFSGGRNSATKRSRVAAGLSPADLEERFARSSATKKSRVYSPAVHNSPLKKSRNATPFSDPCASPMVANPDSTTFANDENDKQEEEDNVAVATARQPSQEEEEDQQQEQQEGGDENTPPDFLTQDTSLLRKTNLQNQEEGGDNNNNNNNREDEKEDSDLDRKPAAKEHGSNTKPMKRPSASAIYQNLQQLRAARTKLSEGKDPLEECRALAERAVRGTTLQTQTSSKTAAAAKAIRPSPPPLSKAKSPPPALPKPKSPSSITRKRAAQAEAMYQRNPTARRVMFESEDDDDDDDVEESQEDETTPTSRRRRKLPALPEKARITTPRARPVVPDDKPPRATNKDHLSGYSTRQRRFFTEEEKQAIREGVKRFGVGKWAVIKAEYAIILRNRTSVQIKDCYRTLSAKESDSD